VKHFGGDRIASAILYKGVGIPSTKADGNDWMLIDHLSGWRYATLKNTFFDRYYSVQADMANQ
jgi:hypothetical protein